MLEDDAPNPVTSAYDELLNNPRDEGPTEEQIESMSAEQLQQVIEGSAQAGKESTARALKIAVETREIGVATAETMQQQTAQLERMQDDLEVVHDHLDKAEGTIEKMTTNKLVRMLRFNKGKGRTADKKKTSRKEEEEREELRAKGLESVDIRELQRRNNEGTMTMEELQRNQLLGSGSSTSKPPPADESDDQSSGSKNRLRLFGGRKKSDGEKRVGTREIKEDYSGYSGNVASVLRQQDDDLDKIGDVVGDLNRMAVAMNNELDYQNGLIDDVKATSAETSKRTKDNSRRIAKIK